VLKKFLLVVSVFGFACVAYLGYQWLFGDSATLIRPQSATAIKPVRPLLTSGPASQPVASFEYRGAEIQPGDGAMVACFNQNGDAPLCTRRPMAPAHDTEFHETSPTPRVMLLAATGLHPGRRWTDRRPSRRQEQLQPSGASSPATCNSSRSAEARWRRRSPNSPSRESSRAVVKIWMDDVSFDWTRPAGNGGPLKVHSVVATNEGRGLT